MREICGFRLCVVALLMVVAGSSHAGFDSKDATAAGFNWKGHNGQPLTPQELQNLCDAIAALATVDPGGAECAETVKSTCTNFCRETGGFDGAARVLPDNNAASAEGDRVNIRSRYLSQKSAKPGVQGYPIMFIHFVGLLAHEMVHTKQDPSTIGGVFGAEKPAYCKEKEVLEALFGSVERAQQDLRYASICKWKEAICAGDTKRCRIFASGETDDDLMLYFDGTGTASYHNGLLVYDPDTGIDTQLPGWVEGSYAFDFDSNCDVTRMTGTPCVAVSGTRETAQGTEGVIQYVMINTSGTPIVSTGVVNLGTGLEPSRLAWDAQHQWLYVLDMERDRVHVVKPSGGSWRPTNLDPTPFATSATFPQITGVQEIDVGEDGAIYVTEQDLNVFTYAFPDGNWFRLEDTNADGVADALGEFLEQEGLDFMASTIDPVLLADQTTVTVMAPLNTTFQVWSTELDGTPVELLAAGFNDDLDLYEEPGLARPLVSGERIMLYDVGESRWSGMETRVVE